MNPRTTKLFTAFAIFALVATAMAGIVASRDNSNADSTATDPTTIQYYVFPNNVMYADVLTDTATQADVTVMPDESVYQYLDPSIMLDPTLIRPILDTTSPIETSVVGSWYSYIPASMTQQQWSSTNAGFDGYVNSISQLYFTVKDNSAIDDTWVWGINNLLGYSQYWFPYSQFSGIQTVAFTDGTITTPNDGVSPAIDSLPIGEVTITMKSGDTIEVQIESWKTLTIEEPGWYLVHQGTGNGSGNGSGNGNGSHISDFEVLGVCICVILIAAAAAYFVAGFTGTSFVTIIGLIALGILYLIGVL